MFRRRGHLERQVHQDSWTYYFWLPISYLMMTMSVLDRRRIQPSTVKGSYFEWHSQKLSSTFYFDTIHFIEHKSSCCKKLFRLPNATGNGNADLCFRKAHFFVLLTKKCAWRSKNKKKQELHFDQHQHKYYLVALVKTNVLAIIIRTNISFLEGVWNCTILFDNHSSNHSQFCISRVQAVAAGEVL